MAVRSNCFPKGTLSGRRTELEELARLRWARPLSGRDSSCRPARASSDHRQRCGRIGACPECPSRSGAPSLDFASATCRADWDHGQALGGRADAGRGDPVASRPAALRRRRRDQGRPGRLSGRRARADAPGARATARCPSCGPGSASSRSCRRTCRSTPPTGSGPRRCGRTPPSARSHYPVCDDRRTLLWLANQRAVEYHPALMRVDSDRQTHLILDLDPPDDVDRWTGSGWRWRPRCWSGRRSTTPGCRVASRPAAPRACTCSCRSREDAEIPDVAAATRAVAARAARLDPAVATTEFVREERGGKVFVDSTRAGGATVVAAYSPRARPGVPVSFPVTWDELEQVRPRRLHDPAPRSSGFLTTTPGPTATSSPQALPADLVAEGHEIPIAAGAGHARGQAAQARGGASPGRGGRRERVVTRRPGVVEPHRGARLPVHVGQEDSTVTDAGLSSIRNTDSSGAWSAVRDQGLDRGHVADHDDGLAGVRLAEPLEPGEHPLLDLRGTTRRPGARRRASRARRRGSSLSRSATSAKVSPSQVPNSISAKPGSTSTVVAQHLGEDLRGLQRAAYRRGDHRVDALGDRRQPLGGGADLARPSSLRPGLALARPPENRFAAVCGVTPCRTRISVVGGPPGGPAAAAGGLRDVGLSTSSISESGSSTSAAPADGDAAALAVERLVGEPVGVLVLLARHPGVRRAGRRQPVRPPSASGRMSGCLIFQRPDICSTTSLESIRTSISASGANSSASLSPAIRPEYSATLLVATPIVVPSSAMTSPVAASLSTAPYAAGPGLPREPPSASMMTEVPVRLTDPTRACGPGSAGTPRSGSPRRQGAERITASSDGSSESRQPLHSRARSAAAATPLLEAAQPVVERQQVVRHARPRWATVGCDRLRGSSSISCGPARRARVLELGQPLRRRRRPRCGQRVEVLLGLLEPRHHLELVVLEAGDPALAATRARPASARGPWGW